MPRYAATDRRAGFDLVAFDSAGAERPDDPDGLMSDLVLRTIAADDGVTDVFLLSHGWMADLPAARAQYDKWVQAMSACPADVARVRELRPGFTPHVVGVHWPSVPWAEETVVGGGSFAADPVAAAVDDFAARIADTPAARDAIRRIVAAAIDSAEPDTLPPDVAAAYRELNFEADLGIGGVGSRPGDDRAGFDPEGVYQSLREDAPGFGLPGGGLLGVLRTLSFWRLKDRAREFGESTGATYLARLMQAAPRDTRFHLMGHSFGCIVLSAALAGPKGRGRLARPVDSLALVQGPLSLWSYCDEIPARPGQPGYFNRVFADRRVRGPVLATRSAFDTATGKWYPLGAGVARQASPAAPGDPPKYGAIGTHGIRGRGTNAADLTLLPATGDYHFAPGQAYNLECSAVIRDGSGRGGAHNDICHPEVAHAVWQAAIAAG